MTDEMEAQLIRYSRSSRGEHCEHIKSLDLNETTEIIIRLG